MRLCFVIMPIGAGDAYEVYLNRYINIIKPAIESIKRNGEMVYNPVRADFISSTGSINRNVLQHIYNADVVVADLTDLNPNVFYELGVRHSLRDGTILLALKGTKLPFDISDLKVIFYEDKVGGEKTAIPQIQQLLERFMEEKAQDSPVFLALPDLQSPSTKDLHEAKAHISVLEKETTELRIKLSVAEQTNLNLRESFANFEQTIKSALERTNEESAQTVNLALEDAAQTRGELFRHTVPNIAGSGGDPKAMFVLMPFREEFDGIYAIAREVGKSLGFNVLRADEMTSPGLITDQVLEAISHSGVIVADLTNRNPNVLYEVGIAHTLGKKTILLAQAIDDVPFDLASQRILIYENSVSGAKKLEQDLRVWLQYLNTGEDER